MIGEAIDRVSQAFTKDVRKLLRAKQRADKSCEELASFDDVRMTMPKGIKPFTWVTSLAELDEAMEDAQTQKLVFAVNVPKGPTRRQALEVVYWKCSKFAKQVDNGALKEKAKHAERETRKQTFLEASLAASREAVTHSSIDGLFERPKQKEINRRMTKSTQELNRN